MIVGRARHVFLSHSLELRKFPVARSFVAAAESAVVRAGDAVCDMAYFTARDDKPAAYCQLQVRKCDIYVGLIGLRYGSPVRDRPEVSYTELELQTATEAGITRLVFLLDENEALPIPVMELLDTRPRLQARQKKFRARLLEAGITIVKVTSPEDLELKLLQALNDCRAAASEPSRPSALHRWAGPACGRAGLVPAPRRKATRP